MTLDWVSRSCINEIRFFEAYTFVQLKESPIANDAITAKLPYSIRVLLESAVRNCDNIKVLEKDVETILNWGTSNCSSRNRQQKRLPKNLLKCNLMHLECFFKILLVSLPL